ncbi:MAG: hypothetical protein MZV64_27255 [Ignavibacteriales bacterium]|nr:hypothetical protein [Ignavibacteriales bacterium]
MKCTEIVFNTSFQMLRDLFIPSVKDFGFCKGENLYCILKNAIEEKFYGENYDKNGNNKPVTFKDLKTDLVVIATNISKTTFKEYSKLTTPDVEVATAVRASISIHEGFSSLFGKAKIALLTVML